MIIADVIIEYETEKKSVPPSFWEQNGAYIIIIIASILILTGTITLIFFLNKRKNK